MVGVIDGQRQLIGGNCDGNVYSINARTGKPIWSFRMSLRGLNTSPVIDGNYVYMSHGEDNIDSPEFGSVQCIDATGTGDVTDTHSVWRVDGVKAGYTGLVFNDGILYVMADLGNLYAFDGKTGEQLWQHDLGTVGKGSPVWADGKIYATEVNGHMWIIKPSREACVTLSEVVLPAREGAGVDEIYASPAIANGRVFLVTRDRTLCIEDKTKQVVLGQPRELPAENASLRSRRSGTTCDRMKRSSRREEKSNTHLHAFDANGGAISTNPASNLTLGEGLEGFQTEDATLIAPTNEKNFAGTVTCIAGRENRNRSRPHVQSR